MRRGTATRAFHIIGLTVTCLALLLSRPARASEPPAEYQATIDQALSEADAGRWQEARALFRHAHSLYPNARTLRGIGIVAFELRDYVDAIKHLRLALEHPEKPLTLEQRREAEGLLERCYTFVARFSTDHLPADTELYVDGHRLPFQVGGVLVLPFGTHHLEIRSGGRTTKADVVVRGGEVTALPIVPRAAPPPAPAQPEEPPPPAEPTAEEPTSNIGPITLTAVGVAMATAGAVLLAVGLSEKDTVENAAPGTPWSEVASARDNAPLFTGFGIGLLGGGVAAAAGGLVWLNAGPEPDVRSDDIGWRAVGGVRGTW